MRKKQADYCRINNLKRDLESKNFFEVKNSTLKNLKDEKDFDIIGDIQKKLEIRNNYDDLINLNNKYSIANNQIENLKQNNIKDKYERRERNTKIEDKSEYDCTSNLNQLNYNNESRNLNNNSNNMINIFQSDTNLRKNNNNNHNPNMKGKKIDYENIRNKKVNIIYNHEKLDNINKIINGKINEAIGENNKQNDKNLPGITRLEIMDPLGIFSFKI